MNRINKSIDKTLRADLVPGPDSCTDHRLPLFLPSLPELSGPVGLPTAVVPVPSTYPFLQPDRGQRPSPEETEKSI